MKKRGNNGMAIVMAFCAMGFVLMSILVANHGIDGFDNIISGMVRAFRAAELTKISNFLAVWGSPRGELKAAIILAMLGAIWAWFYRREKAWSIIFQFSLFAAVNIAAYGANHGLKDLFHRPRPLPHISSYSYPGDHAMMAFAFYVTAAWLLWQWVESRSLRTAVVVGCGLTTLAIGLSRIYLNRHYPSDIVAGFLAGGCILAAGIWVFGLMRTRITGNGQ